MADTHPRRTDDFQQFSRAVLDGLSAHIAILDGEGTILAVNAPWEAFGAANGLADGKGSVGDNYLRVCDQDTGDGIDVGRAIRAVLAGSLPYYSRDYACHSASEQRWFTVRVTPLRDGDRPGVVVAHENISGRKLAEAARLDVEDRLGFALHSSRIGSWEVDLHNGTATRSAEHARIFGYDPADTDWSLDRFLEHVLPSERQTVAGLVRHGIEGNRDFTVECRIRRADGDVRWIWFAAGTQLDQRGRAQRLSGIVQDITDRKRESDALLERERLLGIVTGTARVGLVIVGADYRYQFANKAYADLFGLSAHDIIGRRIEDVLPEGWAQIQPRLDRALGGERLSFELTLPGRPTALGPRHFLTTYDPQSGDQGQRTVVVVVVDITQRKQAEDALRTSEERLRLMVEGVSDHAIVMLDAAGHVLTWSHGAERVAGYAADEVVGQHYSRLFMPARGAGDLAAHELRTAAAEGQTNIAGWRVRKNGLPFWATGTLAALYDSSHRVHGFSMILRDLTASRRNDELLRSVLDHTLDAIVSIDERGTVTMFNGAAERMFDRRAADVIGQSVNLLMPEPHRSAHDGYLRDTPGRVRAPSLARGGKCSAFGKTVPPFRSNSPSPSFGWTTSATTSGSCVICPRRRCSRRSSSRPRKWRPSGNWPAEWPTTSTTC